MRRFWLQVLGLLLLIAFTHSIRAQIPFYVAEEVGAESTPGTTLDFPTDLAFTPDGSIAFVTEKHTGRVRMYEQQPDGSYVLRPQPFVTVAVSLLSGRYHERGLTSVAVDSYYPDNPYIYVYYTALRGSTPVLRISRWEDLGGVGGNGVILREYPLLDNTYRHVAAKIRHNAFDGMLYIAIGDNNRPATAQVLSDPHGKLHRINPYDGSVPPDNPFAGSSVYAYGLRHTFGLCVHPFTGEIYGVDNGEACDDRALKIVAGQNYGWGQPPTPNCPFGPSVIWRSGTAPGNQVSPAGCTFLTTDAYTGYFPGDLLFGEWNTRNISRITLTGPDLDQGTRGRFFTGSANSGRVTAVEQGPDGYVYFTSCLVADMFPLSCPQGRLFRLIPG